MKFYEVVVQTNEFAENENAATAKRSVKKQNIARKTDTFLQEYEERACIFMVVADKQVELAVCVKDENIDEKMLAGKFLERLDIPYDELTSKEISLKGYIEGLRAAFRYRHITDDDEYAEKMGLEFFINNREDFYADKIADGGKTTAELKADVQVYHLSDGYKTELNRILSGKKREVFLGNPANYFIITKDDTARRVMARGLVSALYKKGRLQSRRYTIIDLSDRDCSLASLEELYHVNQGATVYLKMSDVNFPEGEQSRSAVDMKRVCEIVKKKGARTLTIFCMDTPSDKQRAKVENYMTGVPLIVFTDNLYKKETAKNALIQMARAENFTVSEDLLQKVECSERSYTHTELEQTYNVWRAEYMGSEVFPEYKKYVTHITEEEKQVQTSDAYKKLQEMVGLTQAKKVIDGAINYFRLQQEFRNRGIEFNRPAMHMCFTGRPGTAKTTVARLVAEILKDNGVLSEGKLVEVGRSQLVGKFMGHTAPQVCELFDRAKGSVLFIDEAYSLVEDRKGTYGTEAINAIVQEMENRREDTIVILAGYPDEMNGLLEWNPGMKSRIAFHVSFDDYTEIELLDITKLLAKDHGMMLDRAAEEKLLSIYAEARKDKSFGNGRFARNLLEKAKFNQANRFMKMDLAFVSDDEIRMLTADDFEYEIKKEGRSRLGFGE